MINKKLICLLILTLTILITTHLNSEAQFIPYYGKNNVKYDTFHWKIFKTDHFDIYFYPEEEEHLEMVATLAEEAYEKISKDLQHDVAFRIPLIFFLTSSEFEQVNYLQVTEGILGVSEPLYNRMAFALDHPPEELKHLITHELAHIFEFSILFGGLNISLIKSIPPLWIMEGYPEEITGKWNANDIQVVRDAILTDNIPYISAENDIEYPEGKDIARASYTIGHAVFDFINDKYDRAGIRQLWFSVKKATYLGQQDIFMQAFGVSEQKFNEEFANWLREKFAPWKEKQTPLDKETVIKVKKPYEQILSATPSPDYKKLAVFTINRVDGEIDLIIISSENGKIIKNITKGYTTKFEYLTFDNFYFSGRNITWSQDGKYIAFFARDGKRRSLFIADAYSGKIKKKYKIKLDLAGAPSFSPDSKNIAFSALSKGISDIYLLNLTNKNITNLTNDIYYDITPSWSPNGKAILYSSRRNGYNQIMEILLDNPQQRIQYTFDNYDCTSPLYSPDMKLIYFSANKNGINNIYALNKETNDMVQLTDVLGGAYSPCILKKDNQNIIYYTEFFKGKYHLIGMKDEKYIAKLSVPPPKEFLSEPIEKQQLKLQIPVSEDKIIKVSPQDIQNKGFKAILTSRPEVISGYTGGTFAIASSLSIEDILGDQRFTFFIQRIYGFETYLFSYIDLGHRLQYATTFIRLNDFFYAPINELYYDIVETKYTGGLFQSILPLNLWSRFELGTGFFKISESFYYEDAQILYEDYLKRTNTKPYLNNGYEMPLSLSYVTETTRFSYWGPISGHTYKLTLAYSPKLNDDFLSRTTLFADVRKYFRTSNRSQLAFRLRAFKSWGDNADLFYFGGGNDFRGMDFREIIGNSGTIINAEYRFPLLPARLVNLPIIGTMRGKVFVDSGKAKIKSLPKNFLAPRKDLFLDEWFGSIGAGFTIFLGGLPFNFEFSKLHNYDKFIDGIHFDFSIGYSY